jgi:hypothetical protein
MISIDTLLLDNGQVRWEVSGATGAGAVFGIRLTGSCSPGTWASLWSFSTNGVSPDTTVPNGAWMFVAKAGSDWSDPQHLLVPESGDPIALKCRKAVADFLRTMAFSRIADRVYEQRTPVSLNISYPCVFVHLWDFQESVAGGTNQRTEWLYPIKVLFATRDGELDERASKEILGWRQVALEAFDWWRPAEPTIEYANIVPGLGLQRFVYPVSGQEVEITGSQMTVNCRVRRFRGLPQ